MTADVREKPERHNHIAREIRPYGKCPACDRFYEGKPWIPVR